MQIFQKSIVKKYINTLDKSKLESAYTKFKEIYSYDKIQDIKTLKEEAYQDGFLRDIFVSILGYTLRPDENYNLEREYKNKTDSKKCDGAILKDDYALAIIELKSTATKDLKAVTDQAFNYRNNQPNCKYIIT
ncbi:MAG: restriction endonuclease subunit M, partial [Bacteroidetes bacterium]|nr:restriction endonuclease subunit M [Bacteroidota bacterium]